MCKISVNAIELCYELFGDASDRPLLLIHGLGAQLTDWDPAFVAMFVERGYYVITFDNRDQGKSTWFDDAGEPDLAALLNGDTSQAIYLVSDMAADAHALVKALGLDQVDVLGVSMGGMIAQQFALDFPEATRTLTSIMSTPDITTVGEPTPEALAALVQPAASDRQGAIDQSIETSKIIGSPGYEFDEVGARQRAALAFDRGHHQVGTARQVVAILSSPDRRPGLRLLKTPSLVVHGEADPLVTPSGGQATADALVNSELWTVPGMGHDIPVAVWPEFFERFDRFAKAQ